MPLPNNRPFFQQEPGLVGFSALPGLRGSDGDVAAEYTGEKGQVLDIVIGGRGNLWLCCFPSSGRLVGDSVAAPAARGCKGVTAPLCILELGPGLVILGLGTGEHSGLHLLCGHNNCPDMSPPTELCPELWPEPGLEQCPDPRKAMSEKGFPIVHGPEFQTCSRTNALIGLLGLDIELPGALEKAPR